MNEYSKEENIKRERHGFTTFWLIYLILNGLTSIFAFTYLREDLEKLTEIQFTDLYCNIMISVGILNAISAGLLMIWKKIGFHGIIISTIIKLYANMQLNSNITAALFGLLDIAILYMILKLRKNGKSAWDWLT